MIKKAISPKQNNGYTVRRQITLAFAALTAFIVIFCFIVNKLFLEKYYLWNKENVMVEAYHSFDRAFQEGNFDSTDYEIEWENICKKNNISVLILDTDYNCEKYSSADSRILTKRLLDYMFDYVDDKNHHAERVERVIRQTDRYTMQLITDSRSGMEFLEMWGTFSNGHPFMFTNPLESIRDSVDLSNQFLLYIGLVTIALGSLFVGLISKKISDPILELVKISERMTKLDFEVRYSENRKDVREVALLGANINELALALKKNISELKTANNTLMRDIEQKEKEEEMRKEFISNVSHELKTPIALIQGYAEGLKEGINDDPEETDYYCEVIIDEASKMNQMVKKLLTLNQLEYGGDQITMERFDIVNLINNYLGNAEIMIRQNEAIVSVEKMDPVYVWADEFKIEEVFMNYLSNALNHLDGDRQIRISLESKDDKVRVTVFNSGQPIPEESLPRIWEKFYKVDKARTRAYGGSGVGLSIVKAIMDSHHQACGVANYDNGVVFWFELEAANVVE